MPNGSKHRYGTYMGHKARTLELLQRRRYVSHGYMDPLGTTGAAGAMGWDSKCADREFRQGRDILPQGVLVVSFLTLHDAPGTSYRATDTRLYGIWYHVPSLLGLLMIEILHDLKYQDSRKYGTIANMESGRISIIKGRKTVCWWPGSLTALSKKA